MANGFTIPDELVLNLGKYPNDGTGDDLYTAFDKIKQTFTLINSELGVLDGESIGTGEEVFSSKVNNKLQFRTIEGIGNVTVTTDGGTIKVSASSNLESETAPTLGGNLDLNGHNIVGTGNINITGLYNGVNIQSLYNQVQTFYINFSDLDLGNNWTSTTGDYDLGGFVPL